MNDLLDHPLIKKYFGAFDGQVYDLDITSKLILRAMQQPIKKGERYLYAPLDRECDFIENEYPREIDGYHPSHLRIPDQFQKKEENEQCKCHCHMTACGCCSVKKPDPVEEKIQEICKYSDADPRSYFADDLCELVHLARKQ